MTSLELGWLAGWLEGEGSFLGKHSGRRSYCVRASCTDYDIIFRANELMDANLTGPYSEGGHRKDRWVTSLYQKDKIISLLIILYPLMGERRREAIIDILDHYYNG